MNKHEARNAVSRGTITLGMLRNALKRADLGGRSVVNPGLSKQQAMDILCKAIAADERADATVMNGGARDILTATNVIRECGLTALLCQQEAKEAQERKDAELVTALASAPATLTLRDPEGWAKAVEVNSGDPYSNAVITYAERWGRLMEGRIAAGEKLEACAVETSHLANNEGITGFMYGAAVVTLSQVWIHGEQLRRWHNMKTQICNEGEKANESGGVLNPALLTIG